jgi:hypothetical protein
MVAISAVSYRIAIASIDVVLRLSFSVFTRLVSGSIEAIFGRQESIGVLIGGSGTK